MSQLKLERPIVFFDLETTGLDVTTARIVEIALLKIYPDASEETLHCYVNPEMPIPAEATRVHGVTNEMVANMPNFQEVGKRVAAFLENCDLGGFNCNKFDIPLLNEEFKRAGVMIDLSNRKVVDVFVIYRKRERRTLSAAYQLYTNKQLEGAHSADVDTRATYEVLLGQLERYEDLPNSVEELDKYTTPQNMVDLAGKIVYNKERVPCFNFGKHRGKPVVEVLEKEPSYLDWILKGNFAEETKDQLRKIAISIES